MPDIFLDLRRIDFVSDRNAAVSAWRGYADVLFTTATSALATFSCIVDTGAPFSVLPFSLWQSYSVQWNPLGQQLTREGKPISTLLVAPMVGMSLMAPSYILAILGSLVRSFSADPRVSSEGRE